jgi:uncharacterized protein (TIGR02145 family)
LAPIDINILILILYKFNEMKKYTCFTILTCLFLLYGCEKDSGPENPDTIFNLGVTYGNVTDADGNTYKTVQIGTQTWMAENLRTTKFNDGTAIPNATSDQTWSLYTTSAYCWYNNDISNKPTYGALYNWFVITDGHKICPTGWHIPSDADWVTLISYLGGDAISGGKMKETGTGHWMSPNTGATNSSGFSALPGGGRNMGGTFAFQGQSGFWWSSTSKDGYEAYTRMIDYNYTWASHYADFQSSGFSIRCVKDVTP